MKKEKNLPNYSLSKRGLSRTEAAWYVGVGTSKFDEMVKDGRMPAPIRIDSRVVWDATQVNQAFDSLLDGNADSNPWDDALTPTSSA